MLYVNVNYFAEYIPNPLPTDVMGHFTDFMIWNYFIE